MAGNVLTDFPNKSDLLEWYSKNGSNEVHEVNGHFHTPYSFSAFKDIRQVFEMAKEENVSVLGINDFYTMAGYEEFHDKAIEFQIFPLFNIEFIGLLREEQKHGIRVNDPDNPGRIYLSGKGLDYPVSLDGNQAKKLDNLITETQEQAKKMIELASRALKKADPELSLDYDEILTSLTMGMIRERHIARAIRMEIFDKHKSAEDRKSTLTRLYSGKESKANIENASAVEGEIRGNLLKTGGAAYVKEDPKAFLDLDEVIRIITESGGIPTYPVLLDDKAGNFTDFERDKEKLYRSLTAKNIYSLELIPGRNDFTQLKEFVSFFHDRNFIITFGTEHNTPELIPVKVTTRGGIEPDEDLKFINFEGACLLAAHQYLRANKEEGYLERNGKPKINEKDEFIELGNAVIEYFIQNNPR